MKRMVGVICVALTASLGVSLAAGAAIAPGSAWLEPKAERILKRDVEIGLPRAEKAQLETELRTRATVFRGLQMWALDEGDDDAWWTYHGYASRYEAALFSIERGLRIEAVHCAGSGRAIAGGRYTGFTCLATSAALSIPLTELVSSDGTALPTVIEGETRIMGPFVTQLKVRVTGNSTLAYE